MVWVLPFLNETFRNQETAPLSHSLVNSILVVSIGCIALVVIALLIVSGIVVLPGAFDGLVGHLGVGLGAGDVRGVVLCRGA